MKVHENIIYSTTSPHQALTWGKCAQRCVPVMGKVSGAFGCVTDLMFKPLIPQLRLFVQQLLDLFNHQPFYSWGNLGGNLPSNLLAGKSLARTILRPILMNVQVSSRPEHNIQFSFGTNWLPSIEGYWAPLLLAKLTDHFVEQENHIIWGSLLLCWFFGSKIAAHACSNVRGPLARRDHFE